MKYPNIQVRAEIVLMRIQNFKERGQNSEITELIEALAKDIIELAAKP